jgi:hypothetical protein
VSLRGYFQSYEPEYKRIKIMFTEDEFTEKYITNSAKSSGHSPTFVGGFYIKYNGKSKFTTGIQNTTIDSLKEKHIICEVQKKIYSHADRSGWYLLLKEMKLYD